MKQSISLKTDFQPTFWVANGMELFERLAYYGQNAVLSIFLRDHIQLSIVDVGKIQSLFGGLLYALPIIGGTIADKVGFRRSFALAFSLLTVGYFLIGSTGMKAFSEVYSTMNLFSVLSLWVIITAIGGSFIKPSVLGTVAFTTNEKSKSLGYAIYYWLVNVGAALGPAIAFAVRNTFGIENVFLVSSLCCFLMVIVNYFWFYDTNTQKYNETIVEKGRQLLVVLRNSQFVLFLLLFSLFWIVFWQIYIIIPLYVKDYINSNAPFEIISSAGAWGIILFQLLINRVTKGLTASRAIVLGFLVASVGWLLPALSPSIPTIIVAIVIFSIGEMIQAPRYYEYIATIAPTNQVGMYQGFAFLPIALAYALGGIFGTWIYQTVAIQCQSPQKIWFVLSSIGICASIGMILYNKKYNRYS
ncbi:MAG: MFS transporter [Bacteroidetes bacterium]|nr:MFS transporter [Bacteroidota bacterium]